MVEKNVIGYQSGNRDNLPSRGIHQDPVELLEIGNAGPRQIQYIDAVEKCLRRPARQHLLLTGE